MATHVFSLCFGRMLQVFQLFRTYVANVSSRRCKSKFGVAHIAVRPICSNRPTAAAEPAYMCVGFEGARLAGVGNSVGASRQSGTRHGATRDTDWAHDTVQRGTLREAGAATCLCLSVSTLVQISVFRKIKYICNNKENIVFLVEEK
jgi:hypothetical protein